MSIRKKIVAISQAVGQLEFKKTDFQGVDIYTSEYINSMIKPIFDEHGVVPIVNVQYGQDKVAITIQYIHDGEDELIQTVEHPINTALWGGGNITLTNKYAYILMFQIGTKDDVSLKATRDTAFGPKNEDLKANIEYREVDLNGRTTSTKTIKLQDTAVYNIGTHSNSTLNIQKAEDIHPPEGMMLCKTDELQAGDEDKPVDQVLAAINNVVKDEDLEIIVDKPEKQEPQPDQALFERLNEGEWKIKVAITDCMSEVSAVKSLDEQYKMIGTDIYGYKDLALCPIPIESIIDLFPRRSNSKIRLPLIQYRVFGEEAAWKMLEVQTSRTRADLEVMLTNKKSEQPEETLKPVIHKLSLPFEISEHIGIDRNIEVTHKLFSDIKGMGLSAFMIIYALGKMKDKPEIDTTGGDDGIITNFLSKASRLQIEEMIKLAMSVAA